MLYAGTDPRTLDLAGMLALAETAIRRGCKDEKAWAKTRQDLYAPPKHVVAARRRERRASQGAGEAPGRRTVSDATALMASINAPPV